MRTLMLAACLAATSVAAEEWATLPGAAGFASVLKYEDSGGRVDVAAFELMTRPVTNRQFLAFVTAHPEWRQSAVPTVFAEPRYLQHWRGALKLGDAGAEQPVIEVSWFAAQAYCEAINARLPTWTEWEYAAAADATRADARSDPAWREQILGWYSTSSSAPLTGVGQRPADVHGIHDLHGLVWEWVEDASAMLVSGDNREQGDPDLLRFCGAGAISMDDRDNYAVLMRVAMLSSLEADDTGKNLGFRCARDARTP